MFKHHVLIAIRHLWRNKAYTSINLFGLALGFAAFILIALFVWDETRYDEFHAKANRIYRITTPTYARTAPKLGPTLWDKVPEIEQSIRLKAFSGVIKHANQQFYEDDIMFAEAPVLEVFSFDFKEGDPQKALQEPYSIVVSERMAEKYFGTTKAVGKVLSFLDTLQLTVTGVVANWPQHTHLKNEGWISFSTYEKAFDFNLDTWSNNIYYTYVLLRKGVEPSLFEQKLTNFTAENINTLPNRDAYQLTAQNILAIHLQSDKGMELEPNGNQAQVWIFSCIALFILLIAGINFVNLSTARATQHAKEIGVRKTIGATFPQLVKQFLGESVLLTCCALLVAMLLVVFGLPLLNQIADKSIGLEIFKQWPVLVALLGMATIVGILAGIYPAFVLSSFDPQSVLKGGKAHKEGRTKKLRYGLVMLQFGLSLCLLVGTFIVTKQLAFMKNQSLGFEKDQIVVVPFYWDGKVLGQFDLIKDKWEQHANIESVTASGDVPGRMATTMRYWAEGMAEDDSRGIDALYVHKDFIPTYGIEMIAGRAFDHDISKDLMDGYIVNEFAAKSLGWEAEEAIGKRFTVEHEGRIVGVSKDFHFNSLHSQIRPLVIGLRPDWCGYLSVRLSTEAIGETLVLMEGSWNELFPDRPMQHLFMDEDFERHYMAETKLSRITSIFALLAGLIASIGLLGLATYACTQRTKEIAVRKIVGAKVLDIVSMLTGDFAKPVLWAFLIASPVAYWLLRQWLENFAHHVTIAWWWFPVAGGALLLLAGLAVSLLSLKAALANPAQSLRTE